MFIHTLKHILILYSTPTLTIYLYRWKWRRKLVANPDLMTADSNSLDMRPVLNRTSQAPRLLHQYDDYDLRAVI